MVLFNIDHVHELHITLQDDMFQTNRDDLLWSELHLNVYARE
jgi:hypothetical protein